MNQPKSNQEAFDIVYRHLLTQNIKAMEPAENGMCVYRGSNGTKCAVGVLIPDELYSESMEGEGYEGLMQISEVSEYFEFINPDILIELQKVHDDYSVNDWAKALEAVAHLYNLIIPSL